MLHLLSIELLKLKKNRQFIILLASLALGIIGVNYITYRVIKELPVIEIVSTTAWHLVSYFCGFLFFMPAMIIIMLTCSEYTYRTHRQNIIDGLTRRQYVSAKLMLVVSLALFTTVLVFLSAFMYGLLTNTSFDIANLKFVVYYFIQSLLYISFAFLLALFLKRSILTMSIYITYSMIAENILEHKLKPVGDLLPLASADNLIRIPVQIELPNFLPEAKPELVYLTFAFVYIIICGAICYYKYEKQDL